MSESLIAFIFFNALLIIIIVIRVIVGSTNRKIREIRENDRNPPR